MNGRLLAAAGLGLVLLVVAIAWNTVTPAEDMSDNYYEIETRYGSIVIRLFDETPEHRDNFAKLVAEQFYDGTTFHRVIQGFMIQGGDPNSKDDDPLNDGQGGPGYTLPAEIRPEFLHRRGAVAAARQADRVNPARRSSGSQFYIVHGTPRTPEELSNIESDIQRMHPSFAYSDEVREHYTTVGGAAFLDLQYTVFGEVVEGLDVLDAIATVETPKRYGQGGPLADRPVTPVEMTVTARPDYRQPD